MLTSALWEADGIDIQVVPRGIKVSDPGFQFAAGMLIELSGRFVFRLSLSLYDHKFASFGTDKISDFYEEPFPHSSPLGVLGYCQPVKVPCFLGKGALAITGKPNHFTFSPSEDKLIGRIISLGYELGPQLQDDFQVLRAEKIDPAR